MMKLNKPECFNIVKIVHNDFTRRSIRGVVSYFMVSPYYLLNLNDILKEEWSRNLILVREIFTGIVRGVFAIH